MRRNAASRLISPGTYGPIRISRSVMRRDPEIDRAPLTAPALYLRFAREGVFP